ncbi:helix-turn-helix domain-containing protein [Streptomyces sp. NPDC017941]|uniref:helix-turn-helix domain-containing protein n=1 Tax=Streptomyces sp. NPDC017941 TaxID=3365018 RepID=UPI0037B105DF
MGAEGFADLLKELKERSGLSYGVLAKRLHLSTSTLHRYVNGSAVPVEFAPVERLGRLCKASPQELVELHRRWIVADAGRGRREADVPPEPGEAEPVDASGGEAAPPVPDEVEDGGPLVSDRVPQTVSAKRRRLVVAAAVGAVLALGGTALALQSGSGGTSSDDRAKSSADSVPTAPGEVVEDGKRKQSPAATSSPGHGPGQKKDPRGGGGGAGHGKSGGEKESADKGSGPASSGGPAGGGTGAHGQASDAVPLTVSTHPHHWYDPCGNPYLVARTPERLSPPPNEQDAPGWVSANGAVPAGRQTVKLVVQGTGDDTVVLESLDVRVVGSGAPLRRNAYEMGYVGVGCGGNVPQHSFDVNLDASVPRLTPKSGEVDFPYKVSEKDPAAFYVDADVKAHDVSWFLEMEWSSGTRHGTVRIDDSGKPFRTSAEGDNPTFGFSLDSKKWVGIERNPDGVVEEVR